MNRFEIATLSLVKASNGNPIVSTVTIMLFYIMFNAVEATVERLIFGNRFEHLLDILFQCLFISYSAYSVYMCGEYNQAVMRLTPTLTTTDKEE